MNAQPDAMPPHHGPEPIQNPTVERTHPQLFIGYGTVDPGTPDRLPGAAPGTFGDGVTLGPPVNIAPVDISGGLPLGGRMGDMLMGLDGNLYICTTANSPVPNPVTGDYANAVWSPVVFGAGIVGTV